MPLPRTNSGLGPHRRRVYVPADAEPKAPDYGSMKKADLQAEATERGLDADGTVADLRTRLKAADAEVAAAALQEPTEEPAENDADTGAEGDAQVYADPDETTAAGRGPGTTSEEE